MRPRTLASVADAVDGSVDGDPSVDRRPRRRPIRAQAEPDALFVAIAGERVDGHDFIDDAARRGAAAALVRAGTVTSVACRRASRIPVRALLDLAAAERRSFAGTVVAITGANGKTTTKDLAAAVFELAVPHAREPRVVQQRRWGCR